MEKILIIEKEPVLAGLTKSKLESLGYLVSDVVNEAEYAESSITTHYPSLILMDTILENPEERDGIKLAKEIKSRFNIPIVFYSSCSSIETVRLAKEINPGGICFKNTTDYYLQLVLDIAIKQHKDRNYVIDSKVEIVDKLNLFNQYNPNFLIDIDKAGNILYANQQSFRFLGLNEADLVGKNLDNIGINGSLIEFFKTFYQKAAEKGKKIFQELQIETFMGERYIEVNAVPVIGKSKKTESVFMNINDITDQKMITIDMLNKHKRISDSINYSKQIQEAIFSDISKLVGVFSDSFIYNNPKDTIGGDFAWGIQNKNDLYIAMVDCTGHGVPGAMMSLIGCLLLNEITRSGESLTPSVILDRLNSNLRKTLKQDQLEVKSRDGMDVALCKIDPEKGALEYAGAHRPMYILKDGEIETVKGDRKGVGGKVIKKKLEGNFSNTTMTLEKGDSLYLFSDGLPDQMGGEKGLKFSSSRIKEIIKNNHKESMADIKNELEQELRKWIGVQRQTDDMLMIGIRF